MNDADLIYQLSLLNVPHVGNVQARALCEQFETAQDVFNARQNVLEKIENIGRITATNIKKFRDFRKAEKEIAFIKRYGIEALFIKSDKYPRRLLNCYDPPLILFYKGNADLNASKIISIVGTRRNSEYGRSVTEKIIRELSRYNVIIVSGLAFGIDAIAHNEALKHGLKTIGVVGHGLDTIYPAANAGLAREMIKSGGLLTEFKSFTKPDKFNFPSRNRIVAGISDATVIIESNSKGGSIITADLANDYHRDVFAVPGRITDSRSTGCNNLIRDNRAILLDDPAQIAQVMKWQDTNVRRPIQPELFVTLNENEQQIVDLLKHRELSREELNISCTMSASTLASTLLNLELKNIAHVMPGKRYRLVV